MIGQVIRAKNIDQNVKNKKGPLSHQKIKCSFLEYVQLLMFLFGLCSISDDWPSNQSKQHRSKCKKIKKAP